MRDRPSRQGRHKRRLALGRGGRWGDITLQQWEKGQDRGSSQQRLLEKLMHIALGSLQAN